LAPTRREPTEVEEIDMPRLFALNMISGVLLDEDGVKPRDIIAGERALAREFG
jgi:hypothetical protein